MKKVFRITLSAALILGMTLTIGNEVAFCKAKYPVALAHNQPTSNRIHIGMLKFKEIVEKATGGEIEINIHPASELGNALDLIVMTQTGAIQMSFLTAGMLGGIWPEIQIFDLPFLLPSDTNIQKKVLNGPVGQVLSESLRKNNLRVMLYATSSFKQFISNKPITSPADFKGLKWRTMESPLIIDTYRALGASPATIDYHEVYTALQLGVVDGFENTVFTCGAMKFYEVAKYLIISNHGGFVQPLFVNNKWFEKLPDNYQKILTQAAWDILPVMRDHLEKKEKEWYDFIDKYPGMTITHLSPEAVKAFQNVLEKPLRAKYIEIIGERGKKILEVFDEQLAKEMK